MSVKTKVLLVLFWLLVVATLTMFVWLCDNYALRKQRVPASYVEFEVEISKKLKTINDYVDSVVRNDRRVLDSIYERERREFYKWMR